MSMLRSRTGSNATTATLLVHPNRAGTRSPRSAMRTTSTLQFLDQGIHLVECHIGSAHVIDQHRRGPLAYPNALGKLHRDLAVAAGAARLHLQFLAHFVQHFFAAEQHASQTAADPQACLAQRMLLIAKDAVKAHRV